MWQKLKSYFIPHDQNDYTPHVLQRAAMLAMLGLVILSFTVANVQSLLWQASDWLVSTILPSVIVELTNDERNENGARTLVRNPVLDEAARLKAEHMARNGYFAHYSPEGVSPWYWFDEVSYRYAHAGENLAIHFSNSDEVVTAWMNSPTHRANIIDQKFTEIGVGTARGIYEGYDTVFVVQLFGTPAFSAPSPSAPVIPEPAPVPEADEEPVLLVATTAPLSTDTEFVAVLAETSDLPELVDIEPAASLLVDEPVVVTTVSPVLNTPSSIPTTTESLAFDESVVEPVQVADVAVDDDSVSVYSSTVSTSSGLTEAPPIPATIDRSPVTSVIGRAATQPSTVLFWLYVMLGTFVAVSLTLSILIEIRHQRPVQIAYGFGLLLLMSSLFYLHWLVTPGAVVT